MQAHCVIVNNPFHPSLQRQTLVITEECTVADIAPKVDRPYIVIRNGEPVLRKDWNQLIKDGDITAVVMLPQGGGGGSNPMRLVLMIAVTMMAPYLSGIIQGTALGANLATFAIGNITYGNILTSVIGIAGTALVNAVIPPPKAPTPKIASDLASPSPTYNINAQGNTARLDQAIPVQYGRHIAYPDYAARPYTEYAGNEQYLYQLFCLGAGKYDESTMEIRIEDTSIDNFEEITYEVIQPGGSVTLFPTNVATATEVAGQELLNTGYIGPFTLNASGTVVNAIGMDVVLPRGLYYVNGSGDLSAITLQVKFEARPIDDNGVPTGAGTYTTLGTETITAKTTTPLRKSYRYSVTSARYEVRATRIDTKETSTSYGDEVIWSGARGYMPETRNYGNVTLIAMRMKASNNLSQLASKKINVISTRMLPTYRGTENLLTYSEQIDTWTLGSATVAANTAETTDPEGGNTAEKITGSGIAEATPSKTTTVLTANKVYTASIYVKADTAAFVRLRFNEVATWFDLSDGTVGIQYTDGAGAIPLDNGWYRLYIVENVNNTTEAFSITPAASDGGTISSGILYAWGAQINEGETPTTYIHTTTSVYNAWSDEVATTSIAWALADMLRNTYYGAKLSDNRIDLDALYTLDQLWTTRGDKFNGRLDSVLTFWEALQKVATAGRAKPFLQGGIVRFVRDEDKGVPMALYSMRNIKKGSFKLEYLLPTEDTGDSVDVAYFDEQFWAPRRVTAKLPTSSGTKPAKIDLFGVTNRDQAYREGLYQCASNYYRRRLINFTTEMEGFIPAIGDMIAVQHDMPGWAQHAEIINTETTTNICLSSEVFDYTLSGNVWLNGSSTLVNTTEVNAPDGKQTADKLTAVTDLRPRQDFTGIMSGGTYCFSCYVKAGTSYEIRARINGVATWFDIAAGTILTQYTDYAGIEDIGDGWFRIYIAETAITNEFVEIYCIDYDVSTSAAAGDCYLWGAQVNEGTSPLPYAKTTSETVSATLLTLSNNLTWDTTGTLTHYIGLRDKDGSIDGPYEVEWGGTNKIVVIDSLPFTPYIGGLYERTHITFGWAETWRQEAIVISVRPRSLYEVDIVAINEDPSVHTADEGVFTPPVQSSQLPVLYTSPVILNLTIRSSTDDSTKALLSWSPAPGADTYQIEMAYGLSPYDADLEWTRVGETSACSYAVTAIYGSATLIRVRAIGLTVGPWITMLYGAAADYMWSADSSTLMWSVTDTDPMWSY